MHVGEASIGSPYQSKRSHKQIHHAHRDHGDKKQAEGKRKRPRHSPSQAFKERQNATGSRSEKSIEPRSGLTYGCAWQRLQSHEVLPMAIYVEVMRNKTQLTRVVFVSSMADDPPDATEQARSAIRVLKAYDRVEHAALADLVALRDVVQRYRIETIWLAWVRIA